MASPPRPRTRTASMCTAQTAQGTHVFKITGYSGHKGLGVGNSIRSSTFTVGGYDWFLRYFPDGDGYAAGHHADEDYVTVLVGLLSKNCKVRALYDLRLADMATGVSSSVYKRQSTAPPFASSMARGRSMFMKTRHLELEESYVKDDCLVIECDLIVIMEEPLVLKTPAISLDIAVPPSELSSNLGELLEAGEEADVTFVVKDEVFPAHKIVLATRSPVFKAELFGPMSDRGKQLITVEDMQPAVFKALLHFVYTDALPSLDDLDGEEGTEMIKHLLVAADRYAMERMKLVCADILSKSLNVEGAAAMLALADQHNCSSLKDACLEFITSSRLGDVVASRGYASVRKYCPEISKTYPLILPKINSCIKFQVPCKQLDSQDTTKKRNAR